MKLGLVIFDCDGVLVDSERLVNRIEADRLKELGVVVTPTEVRTLFRGYLIH
jgi:beta-phosphoglucomutase-like phosphatase (HAD superfamily)